MHIRGYSEATHTLCLLVADIERYPELIHNLPDTFCQNQGILNDTAD